MNKKNVGLITMATHKYTIYIQQFIESARKYFLPNHNVSIYVFTDNLTTIPDGVIGLYKMHTLWPGGTMMRYRCIKNHEAVFKNEDFLYYCDIDMKFMDAIDEEVLSDLVAVKHPAFWDKKNGFPYEYNRYGEQQQECARQEMLALPEEIREAYKYKYKDNGCLSTAHVKPGDGTAYYCGGFQGGKKDNYIAAAKILSEKIDIDLANGVIAINSDESHWNRYLIDNRPTKELTPAYCFPEHKDYINLPFPKKIYALEKDHNTMRDLYNGHKIKIENDKPIINFVTYSNKKYRQAQDNCIKSAIECGFISFCTWNEDIIKKTEFYTNNLKILECARGNGYWLWKPYIILKTLETMKDGDIVVYCDSGDQIYNNAKEKIIEVVNKNNGMMIIINTSAIKEYTKRDAFVLCDAEWPEYYDGKLMEAGVIAIQKNKENIRILSEWLFLCGNYNAISDAPNICRKPNFPEFKDHRHDQSILSIIAIRYKLKTISIAEASGFIKYNEFDKSIDKTITAYMPNNNIKTCDIQKTLFDKYRLPVDFNPSHPDWKMPSKRQRYEMLLKELNEGVAK